MIGFYVINTYDYTYKTANSIICKEERIGENFYYSFRFYEGYLKKHITKNFASLVFKNGADFSSSGTNNRVLIRKLIDDLYVYFSAQEDIDLSSLRHSIRKV